MTRLLLMALVLLGTALAQDIPTRQTALGFEQQGRLDEAEAAWRAVLKAHPADAEAEAHIGLLEARQQHYAEAIAMDRKAMAHNPRLPGLRLNLALALFKQGDLKEAIRELDILQKETPPNSPDAQRVTILLAMAHYGLAEYAEAVPYLQRAAAADPANLPLRMTLAHSCLWSKRYQCVLDVYKQILALNSESAEADMLAGEAADELRDRDTAIAQFRAAIKADPTMPDAHFGLGYLLWTRKQYEEAAPLFEAELAINPAQTWALVYLGDSLMQTGQPDKARPLLEKAVQLDPSLWLAHLDLGILDASADRDEDALREMRLAAKLQPDEVNTHWRLAQLDRKLGNTEEAKAEFAKAHSLTKSADEHVMKKMTAPQAPTPGRQPVLGRTDP